VQPAIAAAIERFLAQAKEPLVLEPGEDPIPIRRETFQVGSRAGWVTLECWTATQNLVRRLRGVREERRGRLELETEHFGGRKGSLLLFDAAHPANRGAERHGGRLKYREQFRLALRRQFPDWKIAALSTEADLEHSLSPAYPRALLRRGRSALAAIGAAGDAGDPDGALSFGLIWLDYLRRREPRVAVGGLALFLPVGEEVATCHRIRYLDAGVAQYMVFVHDARGGEEAVDPRGYANFSTRLEPFRLPLAACDPEVAGWVSRLAAIEGVDRRGRPDGSVSLAARGIEFARTSGRELLFGLDHKHAAGASHLPEIEELARGLLRLRDSDAPDRTNPLYTRQPEAWLEAQVRAAIADVDAGLRAGPLYGQAPEFAAGNRAILDILACGHDGRLAVIEVKASQDIHLPLQALDYWMRVKWHLERGEFTAGGYFPGVSLRPEPPRLLLAAPALEFHPANEIVLRYFSPEVEVVRIGAGVDWRKRVRIMFRRDRLNRPA
jgi:hypothetical protein